MAGSYIVSGARTPVGKHEGDLKDFTAMELGAHAMRAALARGQVAPDAVDYVVMGHVIQAGQGQITARQAAHMAGIGLSTPSTTVNRVCLSGLYALQVADMMIASGQADVVVAGGMESMSQAPKLLGADPGKPRDSMLHDGLTCPWAQAHVGTATEHFLRERSDIGRELQDRYARMSHERAHAAQLSGRLAREIEPIVTSERTYALDEGIRPRILEENFADHSPVFAPDGYITKRNASQISDGGAALIVASESAVRRLGLSPMAEIVGYAEVAGPDTNIMPQPARAIQAVLDRCGTAIGDIDHFEINEAFACVVLASLKELGLEPEQVNPNGGAIAIGHPIGATGARIALALAHSLEGRGPSASGVAALCGGGGQGDAILLRGV